MPGVGVMTTRFVSAADLMARVLGFPQYQYAVIGHPVSSADDAGLRAMAVSAAEQASRLLTGGLSAIV